MYFRGENILLRPRSQMKEMRGKLQIVFQDPYSSLDPRMNVLRLIEDSLRVNGVRDKKSVWSACAPSWMLWVWSSGFV